MSKTYERTFVVAVPVEKAWQAFADPKQREAWMSGRNRMDDPASLETSRCGTTAPASTSGTRAATRSPA